MTADEIRAYLEPKRHEFADSRSLVMPALKYAQTTRGYLSREDLGAVAEATGFTPAFVESVASFYDRLYTEPTGTRIVSVCATLSCMLRGADEVWEHLCAKEGLDPDGHGGISADGRIMVQQVQCLGYCDRAPAVQVDVDETSGPHTPASAAALVDEVRAAPDPEEFWR